MAGAPLGGFVEASVAVVAPQPAQQHAHAPLHLQYGRRPRSARVAHSVGVVGPRGDWFHCSLPRLASPRPASPRLLSRLSAPLSPPRPSTLTSS
eukprot:6676918-Prymnesium_polylepis.1